MKPLAFAPGWAIAVAALAGCASSGVTMLNSGVYLVKKQGGAGIVGYTDLLLADLHEESVAFCLRDGRTAEALKESETPATWARPGSAELRFRCVQA